MIQEIEPDKLNISYDTKGYNQEDYVLLMRNDAVYLSKTEEGMSDPLKISELIELLSDVKVYESSIKDSMKDWEFIYLFEIGERRFFMLLVERYEELNRCAENFSKEGAGGGYYWMKESGMRELAPDRIRFACVTARHLARWYRQHRFCGCCGSRFYLKADERALLCHKCNHVEYPKISPAIIVGIVNGDRLLVTRYADKRGSRYALVAGYCEVGEALEESLRREIMEEVGLKVGEIVYYKSQPWGFSDSLLMGFFAELEGSDEIRIDGIELSEAVWLDRKDIPIDDPGLALTSEMIRVFAEGYKPFAQKVGKIRER